MRWSQTIRCVVACLTVVPASAAAQRWQVDLGGTRVGYDTGAITGSAVLAPTVEVTGTRSFTVLSGALAAFQHGQWAAQGRGDLSVMLGTASNPVRFEIAGSGGGSVHSSQYRTAATRAELRLHWSGRDRGLWAGGHVATGWTSDTFDLAAAVGPTLGAWYRTDTWNALVTWSPVRFDGRWYQEGIGQMTTSVGPLDLVVYGGARSLAAGAQLDASAWGGLSAAYWASPEIAIVLTGGSYPLDLLQALPRGRYVSLSIRLANRRPTAWAAPPTGRAVYAIERGAPELRFTVPNAARVDLVADWTGWQPVPLRRVGRERWAVRITLQPGVYRFNLVVDGMRWIVPQDVAAVDDGFGGQTALLVVP